MLDKVFLATRHAVTIVAIFVLINAIIVHGFNSISPTFLKHPNHSQRSKLLSSSLLSNEEIGRYSRHLVLSDVGVEGQIILKNSRVLVVGAGGLGSPCLLYLAAAGVGTLGIVDADIVDESNLQRQIIHGTSTVGVSKCKSAVERLKELNPHIRVISYEKELTSTTAPDIMHFLDNDSNMLTTMKDGKKWDLVIDGSDNFPTKYLINDACEIYGLPWIYSAILAFEGQVSTFNWPPGVGTTYRDLMPVPPSPGDVPSCAEGGVLGILPGTMGCLQATEAIKILLSSLSSASSFHGAMKPLVGRVLVYDALAMRFTEIGLNKDANRPMATELIDYVGFCAGPSTVKKSKITLNKVGRSMDESEEQIQDLSSQQSFQTITPVDCLQRLDSEGWMPFVLDVRLETEHAIVSLPFTDSVISHRSVGAAHIPTHGDVLVYCKAGVRGAKACRRLIDIHGVDGSRLWNLEGGILRWQADVDPSMPRY